MKAIQLEPLDIVLCHTTASRHGLYEALRSMCRQNLLRVLVRIVCKCSNSSYHNHTQKQVRISENSNISSDELEEMLNRVRDVAYEFDCGENEKLLSSCLKCIPSSSSLRVLILARVGLKPSHKIQNVRSFNHFTTHDV